MTNIKQFNKARTMVPGKKINGVSLDTLKSRQTIQPQIRKGGQRRGKGMMKVR